MQLTVQSASGTTSATFPDRFPVRRLPPPPSVFWCPFSYNAYPVPDVLASLTFQPVFPAKVYGLHRSLATVISGTAPLGYQTFGLGWLPIMPTSRLLRRPQTRWPTVFAPPPSEQVVIAQQQAWMPRMPAHLLHRRPTATGYSFLTDPSTFGADIPCLLWADLTFSQPILSCAFFSQATLTEETFTIPHLTGEAFC